jgi:hypothetical protein
MDPLGVHCPALKAGVGSSFTPLIPAGTASLLLYFHDKRVPERRPLKKANLRAGQKSILPDLRRRAEQRIKGGPSRELNKNPILLSSTRMSRTYAPSEKNDNGGSLIKAVVLSFDPARLT